MVAEEGNLRSLQFGATFSKLRVLKVIRCKRLQNVFGASRCPQIS